MAELNNILMGLKLEEIEDSPLFLQEELDPTDYAHSYSLSCYPEDALYHDVQLILDFLVSKQEIIKGKQEILDIGSASAIPYSLALSKHANSVYMSDISEEHLTLVKKWVANTNNSRCWNNYTKYILNTEKEFHNLQQNVSANEIIARENEFRKKLQALIKGDLCKENPINSSKKFDIVSCFYAAEPAATSFASRAKVSNTNDFINIWCKVIENIVSLIKPGGDLFMSCLINTDYYAIFDENKKTSRIKIQSISSDLLNFALDSAKLDCLSVDYATPIGLSGEGINKIAIVHARKSN